MKTAQRSPAQREFVARGRASLARARTTNRYHDAANALAAMQQRLAARIDALRQRS